MTISAEPIIAKFLLGAIPRPELPLHANASSNGNLISSGAARNVAAGNA
jgi:hypothetical protein